MRSEKGSVAIFVGIALPLILMFLILVVDFGLLHYQRSRLQSAADAATLAGVTYTEKELDIDYDRIMTELIDDPEMREFKTVDIGVHLNKCRDTGELGLAEERARETFEKNINNMPNTTVSNEDFKSGDFGSVYYAAGLEKKDENDYGFDGDFEEPEMTKNGANAYTLSFDAEIPTVLLGDFLRIISSFATGEEINIDTLTWHIYSKSEFNKEDVIRLEGGE